RHQPTGSVGNARAGRQDGGPRHPWDLDRRAWSPVLPPIPVGRAGPPTRVDSPPRRVINRPGDGPAPGAAAEGPIRASGQGGPSHAPAPRHDPFFDRMAGRAGYGPTARRDGPRHQSRATPRLDRGVLSGGVGAGLLPFATGPHGGCGTIPRVYGI